jgi:hypothetical protein
MKNWSSKSETAKKVEGIIETARQAFMEAGRNPEQYFQCLPFEDIWRVTIGVRTQINSRPKIWGFYRKTGVKPLYCQIALTMNPHKTPKEDFQRSFLDEAERVLGKLRAVLEQCPYQRIARLQGKAVLMNRLGEAR